MFLKKYVILCFAGLILLPLCHARARAQDFSAGVRGGASFESDAGDFQQVDLFASKYLPWCWDPRNSWTLQPRWEGSTGWLDDEGHQGFVGTTGPVLELRKGTFPITLEGGVSLTALSRSNFPGRNLGGWFEFTDHVGLDWHVKKQFTVGWRYQHMSNAGIYKHNPGLNLQMFSVAYNF